MNHHFNGLKTNKFFIISEEDLSFENYEQDDTSNDHFITLENFEKGTPRKILNDYGLFFIPCVLLYRLQCVCVCVCVCKF